MQRGFTLVEMAVAVGIIAIILLTAAAFALGTRPLAMRSAAVQFDAQLQAARLLAAATRNGATIVVQPARSLNGTARPGFTSILYGGRPNTPPLTISNSMPVTSDSDIREATVGAPPFSLFISSSGHVSMQSNYPASTQFDTTAVSALPSEPACPPSGTYIVLFGANGASASIALPCQLSVSGTPVPIITNSPMPTPTP